MFVKVGLFMFEIVVEFCFVMVFKSLVVCCGFVGWMFGLMFDMECKVGLIDVLLVEGLKVLWILMVF